MIAWIEKSNLTSKQLKDYKAVAKFIADHINDVYTIIESGQKIYIGEDVELLIRNASDKKKYLYDIVGIKENTTDALDLLKNETRKGSYQTAAHGSVTTISIPRPGTSVKTNYSTKGGGLDALRKQYGEIKPGEKPVRESHVPKKTEKNKKVS